MLGGQWGVLGLDEGGERGGGTDEGEFGGNHLDVCYVGVTFFGVVRGGVRGGGRGASVGRSGGVLGLRREAFYVK